MEPAKGEQRETRNNARRGIIAFGLMAIGVAVFFLLRFSKYYMGHHHSQQYEYIPSIDSTIRPTTTLEPEETTLPSNLDLSVDPCEDFSRHTCSKLYPDLKKEKREIGGHKSQKAEKTNLRPNLEGIADGGRKKRAKPISLNEINEIGGGGRGKRTNEGESVQWETETEKYVAQFGEYCLKQQKSEWYKTSMDKPEIDFLKKEIGNLLKGNFGSFSLASEEIEEVGENAVEKDKNGQKAGNDSSEIPLESIWEAFGQIERNFEAIGLFYTLPMKDERNGLKTLQIHQKSNGFPREYFTESAYSLRFEIYRQLWSEFYSATLEKVGPLLDGVIPSFDDFIEEYLEILESLYSFREEKYTLDEHRKVSEGQRLHKERLRKGTYTLPRLQQDFPSIQWAAYFRGLGLANEMTNSTTIQVVRPIYLGKVNKMTGKLDSRKLKNFAIIALLNKIYALRYSNDCDDILDEFMSQGKGIYYIRQIDEFERDEKVAAAKQIVQNIVEEYSLEFRTNKWMTNATKNATLNKIHNLVLHVGWPNWYGLKEKPAIGLKNGHRPIPTIDQFHKFYLAEFRPLRMNLTENLADDLFEFDANQVEYWPMVLAMLRGHSATRFNGLGQPPKYDMDQLEPNQRNAEYDPHSNEITIAYYSLDLRYGSDSDDPLADVAKRYGLLAFTMAHEIAHGYDPDGIFHGPNGQLAEMIDKNSSVAYEQMQQCLIDLYSKGCCPSQAMSTEIFHRQCENGLLTIQENFADISGLTMSHRAFKKALFAAAGRNLTTDEWQKYSREFWTAYGGRNCQYPGENEEVEISLLQEPHSTEECRVRLAVKAVPEFGRDFGCGKGAETLELGGQKLAMAKCNIWAAH